MEFFRKICIYSCFYYENVNFRTGYADFLSVKKLFLENNMH